MEQRKPKRNKLGALKSALISVLPSSFAIIFATSALIGCKQRLANPEAVDPIYADLLKEARAAESSAASDEKAIEALKLQIKDLPARDFTRRHLNEELRRYEESAKQKRQLARFLKIRQEKRLEYIKVAYERAFSQELPWPDMQEYAEYKRLKQLKTVPRSWDARVPKTDRYRKKVEQEAQESGSEKAQEH